MSKFYSKKERQVLEFYKKKLSTNYRILPYDLNKKEDLREYLDLVLMSFMDFKKYWAQSNDLVEELDETVERFDPLTWLSLVDEDVKGNQKMIETMELLSQAQANMSTIFESIDEKLRQLLQVILHHDEEIQLYMWKQIFIYDEEAMEAVIEALLEADHLSTLDASNILLVEVLNRHLDTHTETVEQSILLHLELVRDYNDAHEEAILKKYGKTKSDGVIYRDILVPKDINLHALHFVIQRLFGWQNSHLRHFSLAETDFMRLTSNQFKNWIDLSGRLFTNIGDTINFYDDDYTGGNFKTYLKKKYTGPYTTYDREEFYRVSQENIKILIKNYPEIEVREPFYMYLERTRGQEASAKDGPRILRTASPTQMTIDEIRNAFMDGDIFENLLESLLLSEVLGEKNIRLKSSADLVNNPFNLEGPYTHELKYSYDYGDNWQVKITRPSQQELNLNELSIEGINNAMREVEAKHQPICVFSSGLNVLDDVGGISGYVRFLESIHETDDLAEQEGTKAWAKSLGWSNRRTTASKML